MAHGCIERPHTLQEGACISQHSNGQLLKAHAELARCWPGLGLNTEQKLWAVAFIPAPLKTGLDLFHGETEAGKWTARRRTPLTVYQ